MASPMTCYDHYRVVPESQHGGALKFTARCVCGGPWPCTDAAELRHAAVQALSERVWKLPEHMQLNLLALLCGSHPAVVEAGLDHILAHSNLPADTRDA